MTSTTAIPTTSGTLFTAYLASEGSITVGSVCGSHGGGLDARPAEPHHVGRGGVFKAHDSMKPVARGLSDVTVDQRSRRPATTGHRKSAVDRERA